MTYYPEFSSSSTGPAGLRFVQIVQVGPGDDYTLIGLTHQGDMYVRHYDEDAGTMGWQLAPALCSTDLVEDLTCSACGQTFLKGYPHERCQDCRKGTLLPKPGAIPPVQM